MNLHIKSAHWIAWQSISTWGGKIRAIWYALSSYTPFLLEIFWSRSSINCKNNIFDNNIRFQLNKNIKRTCCIQIFCFCRDVRMSDPEMLYAIHCGLREIKWGQTRKRGWKETETTYPTAKEVMITMMMMMIHLRVSHGRGYWPFVWTKRIARTMNENEWQ